MKAFVVCMALIMAIAASAWSAEPASATAEQTRVAQLDTGAGEMAADEVTEVETSGTGSGWRISNWSVNGRLDYRLMHMNAPEMTTTRGELMAAELETTATIANKDRDVFDLALQFPYLTQMEGVDDRGKEMHFGIANVTYKGGLGKPNIRAGQFVVPFGNLPYYETHTRPLQSLYPESLGVRIDRGVSVEGIAGSYDYWVSATGGNGPRRDNNDSPAVTARVARRLDLPGGTLNAGVSVLHGTEMPRFSSLVDPLMEGDAHAMGMHAPLDFTEKIRVGLDAEYAAGPNLWHAELIGGRDGDGSVNGQFVQWNRTLDDRHEVSLQASRWEQPTGIRTRLGASAERKLDDYATLRLSAERAFGQTPMEERNSTTITLQYVREFPGFFGK